MSDKNSLFELGIRKNLKLCAIAGSIPICSGAGFQTATIQRQLRTWTQIPDIGRIVKKVFFRTGWNVGILVMIGASLCLALRDLWRAPPFAQSLCCIRFLILEIFKIFLWLKPLCALILTEIEHFSKVSLNWRPTGKLRGHWCRNIILPRSMV